MDMSLDDLKTQAKAASSKSESGPLELAVVLPTLNERGNIAPMVERLEKALGPSGKRSLSMTIRTTAPLRKHAVSGRPTAASV